MVRFCFSVLSSIALFFIQCLLVMKVFHYQNGIVFENYMYVAIVCMVNFFIAYSLLSQLTPWFIRVNKIQTDEE